VMEELAPLKKEGNPLVFIDHAFEVKGVGTVLLGVVRSGKISVHDKLVAYPEQTTVVIRNIQKNDVDEKEAFGSDRVGLAVKGASSKDVGRGSLLSPTPLAIIRELPAKIEYSKFSQKDSKTLNAYHCLQSAPCRIDGEKIIFEKQIAIAPGEPIVFCDLNKKMRAVGKMIA